MISHILEVLGEHCKKVLELYKTLPEQRRKIALEMGLSSPEMAKKIYLPVPGKIPDFRFGTQRHG
jgi:hypothetical protein